MRVEASYETNSARRCMRYSESVGGFPEIDLFEIDQIVRKDLLKRQRWGNRVMFASFLNRN
jgi:hypothetical protein